MSRQIVFRSVYHEDVATGTRSGETTGFVREWPEPKYDKDFEPRRGYSAFGELGTWTTIVTTIASSSAFASIIIAWLKSKRRKITLMNGNRTIEYEGPDPVANLKQLQTQIDELVSGEQRPTINVFTEDLDQPPPPEPLPPKDPFAH